MSQTKNNTKMEKPSQNHQEKNSEKIDQPNFHKSMPHIAGRRVIWDCESSLYDSFELKSFKKQLDSAIISSRTLSMPHIPDRHVPHPPPPPPVSKKTSKISKAFHKLIKSVFGSKQSVKINSSCVYSVLEQVKSRDHLYVHDRRSRALSSIPEGSEKGYAGLSPELNSCVRKTVSERFRASPIGIIPCA